MLANQNSALVIFLTSANMSSIYPEIICYILVVFAVYSTQQAYQLKKVNIPSDIESIKIFTKKEIAKYDGSDVSFLNIVTGEEMSLGLEIYHQFAPFYLYYQQCHV